VRVCFSRCLVLHPPTRGLSCPPFTSSHNRPSRSRLFLEGKQERLERSDRAKPACLPYIIVPPCYPLDICTCDGIQCMAVPPLVAAHPPTHLHRRRKHSTLLGRLDQRALSWRCRSSPYTVCSLALLHSSPHQVRIIVASDKLPVTRRRRSSHV